MVGPTGDESDPGPAPEDGLMEHRGDAVQRLLHLAGLGRRAQPAAVARVGGAPELSYIN